MLTEPLWRIHSDDAKEGAVIAVSSARVADSVGTFSVPERVAISRAVAHQCSLHLGGQYEVAIINSEQQG